MPTPLSPPPIQKQVGTGLQEGKLHTLLSRIVGLFPLHYEGVGRPVPQLIYAGGWSTWSVKILHSQLLSIVTFE